MIKENGVKENRNQLAIANLQSQIQEHLELEKKNQEMITKIKKENQDRMDKFFVEYQQKIENIHREHVKQIEKIYENTNKKGTKYVSDFLYQKKQQEKREDLQTSTTSTLKVIKRLQEELERNVLELAKISTEEEEYVQAHTEKDMKYLARKELEKGKEYYAKNEYDYALKCFQIAADIAHEPQAYYHLGEMYGRGDGVPQSLEKSLLHFYQSSLLGYEPAVKYCEGIDGDKLTQIKRYISHASDFPKKLHLHLNIRHWMP